MRPLLSRALPESILRQKKPRDCPPLMLWRAVYDVHCQICLGSVADDVLAVDNHDGDRPFSVAAEMFHPVLWAHLAGGKPQMTIMIPESPVLGHPCGPP